MKRNQQVKRKTKGYLQKKKMTQMIPTAMRGLSDKSSRRFEMEFSIQIREGNDSKGKEGMKG
jgi:hypothetical protein